MKGSFAKRIVLFVATNAAVLLVVSILLSLLGVDDWLHRSGSGLNVTSLLVFSAVFGFTGSLFSLAISKTVAKFSTGAKVITAPQSSEERWLVETVQRLSQQAGIGIPEVAIFDSPELNAFATGARRNHALVAVSSGLLRGMTRDEVEAVLAHEVAHVANGDMVTLTLIQGVVNTFVIFLSRLVGYLVDRFILRSEDEESGPGIGYFVTSIVAQLAFGVLATIIVMWFSRRREFRADEGSAELVGAPAMVSALNRLRSRAGEGTVLPQSVQAFGIRGEGRFSSLFHSHPPLEDRIAALRNAASAPSSLAVGYSAPRNG